VTDSHPASRQPSRPSDARVVFVGAGPGAADLLTLRAANAIAAADVIVWAASLVPAEVVTAHAHPEARLVDSSSLDLAALEAVYARAGREGLTVARVHSGDPSLYSAIGEQIERVEAHGLDWEIVPGVGALSAAAAALGEELTVPEVAQSVICTRLGTATPMPPGEDLAAFAAHGTTLALFLSAKRAQRVQAELTAGGYAPDTPCAVCYRVSWPDQRIVRCWLDQLAATLRDGGFVRHTLVLVGPGLTRTTAPNAAEANPDDARPPAARSRLYDPAFAHLHRLPGGRSGPAPAGGTQQGEHRP
jgi:precorrin-4 C11-methyltransferase